ncbi:hypothetical protein BDN67DRAFT_498035 [Paxillus ammoniavirescens]|nr:hypothetical protein BDN67DRAFT_498035 [Paxillus ammoniavirescens]
MLAECDSDDTDTTSHKFRERQKRKAAKKREEERQREEERKREETRRRVEEQKKADEVRKKVEGEKKAEEMMRQTEVILGSGGVPGGDTAKPLCQACTSAKTDCTMEMAGGRITKVCDRCRRKKRACVGPGGERLRKRLRAKNPETQMKEDAVGVLILEVRGMREAIEHLTRALLERPGKEKTDTDDDDDDETSEQEERV